MKINVTNPDHMRGSASLVSVVTLVVGLAAGYLLTTYGVLPSLTPVKEISTPTFPAPEEHKLITEDEIVWKDAPATLPAGAKIVVIEGDPSQPGPFTIRLLLPAGYTVPPHFHPADEHATVLSGTFAVGVGDSFDASQLTELHEGGFMLMPREQHHFAHSEEGAVIQIHGIGPWGLTYVNPEDDPRN